MYPVSVGIGCDTNERYPLSLTKATLEAGTHLRQAARGFILRACSSLRNA